ncbi:MAG TPA: putative molybdenum carrier protein [Gammaproteobacteria bacterium]|nr:putative molybdenum carrier protein [Gammaproteobacteria bacterium]
MLKRIVSGGQTGVDRAALDVALSLAMPCGGWCPQGRRSADGPIPERYPLRETPSRGYRQRTEWNVRDSDATLVLDRGLPAGGTACALRAARRLGRPWLVIDPQSESDVERVHCWLEAHGVHVLNIAGPRESQQPGIHDRALSFLQSLLTVERGTCRDR